MTVSSSAAQRMMLIPAINRGRSKTVLSATRLELPGTGIVGLVGINGAGKSTLMLELADVLARPRIHALNRFRARAARPMHAAQRDPVSFAPQQPTFPDWLDCVEIARMFGVEYDALDVAFPGLLLHELRQSTGSTLSAGQTQALSIALALFARHELTLLDEPFAPLDFRRRIALSQILRERGSTPGTVIVSSQSAAELLDVCDWLVVLQRGRFVFSGAIEDIVAGARGEAARVVLEDHVMRLL